MEKVQLYEYFKECYYNELQQKETIQNRIALPAGITPLLVAGDIYLLKNLNTLMPFWYEIGVILLFLFTAFLLLTVYYIFRSLYNYQGGYIATPQKVYDYHKSLMENSSYTQDTVDKEMTDYLSSQFAEYGSINRKSNLKRIQFLRFSFYSIVGTLLIGLLCIPVYTLGVKEDTNITRVEIYEKEVKVP